MPDDIAEVERGFADTKLDYASSLFQFVMFLEPSLARGSMEGIRGVAILEAKLATFLTKEYKNALKHLENARDADIQKIKGDSSINNPFTREEELQKVQLFFAIAKYSLLASVINKRFVGSKARGDFVGD